MRDRRGTVIVLAILLAACGSNPSPPSPSPSGPAVTASVAPSPIVVTRDPSLPPEPVASPPEVAERATPTPRAKPSPGPSAGPKPPYRRGDSIVTLTNRLRLRSAPGVEADSIKYKPLLGYGTNIVLRSGPVEASGYWWYKVRLLDGLSLDGGIDVGWLAAADHDGKAWIGPWPGEGDLDPVPEPQLPRPELVATGLQWESRDGVTYINYGLSITNWYEFGRELFEPADVGPCDLEPTRTWVEIVDIDFGHGYTYCWLDRPGDLTRLQLSVPDGNVPPRSIYVVIWDRVDGVSIDSNIVELPGTPFSSPSPGG